VLLGFRTAGCVGGKEDFIEYGPYGFPCARELSLYAAAPTFDKTRKVRNVYDQFLLRDVSW